MIWVNKNKYQVKDEALAASFSPSSTSFHSVSLIFPSPLCFSHSPGISLVKEFLQLGVDTP